MRGELRFALVNPFHSLLDGLDLPGLGLHILTDGLGHYPSSLRRASAPRPRGHYDFWRYGPPP
jgi:hypothetical protein